MRRKKKRKKNKLTLKKVQNDSINFQYNTHTHITNNFFFVTGYSSDAHMIHLGLARSSHSVKPCCCFQQWYKFVIIILYISNKLNSQQLIIYCYSILEDYIICNQLFKKIYIYVSVKQIINIFVYKIQCYTDHNLDNTIPHTPLLNHKGC